MKILMPLSPNRQSVYNLIKKISGKAIIGLSREFNFYGTNSISEKNDSPSVSEEYNAISKHGKQER